MLLPRPCLHLYCNPRHTRVRSTMKKLFPSIVIKYLLIGLLTPMVFTRISTVSAQQDPTGKIIEADAGVPVPDQSLEQDADRYETEISRLESSKGVYDETLGENLLGLGLVYQQQGDHEEAVEILSRAMQIRRVNEGLQNMNQLAVLENIMASNTAIAKWKDLDRNYQQMYWLYRRNFNPDDQEYLDNLLRMGRWKVAVYKGSLLENDSLKGLGESQDQFARTIRYIEKQHGKMDPRLVGLLYGHALINYQLLIDTVGRPLSDFKSPLPQSPTIEYVRVCYQTRAGPVCQMEPRVNYSGQNMALMDAQQQKDQLLRTQGIRVIHSLKQILEITENNQEQVDEKKIRSLVQEEDWAYPDNRNVPRRQRNQDGRDILTRLGLKKEQIDILFGKESATDNGTE